MAELTLDIPKVAVKRDEAIDARQNWRRTFVAVQELNIQARTAEEDLVQTLETTDVLVAESILQKCQIAKTKTLALLEQLRELDAQSDQINKLDFELLKWDRALVEMQDSEFDPAEMPKEMALPVPIKLDESSDESSDEGFDTQSIPSVALRYFEICRQLQLDTESRDDLLSYWQEQGSKREHLRDQGIVLSPDDDAFDTPFQQRRRELDTKIESTKKQRDELAVACLDEGHSLDPTDPRYRRRKRKTRVEHWIDNLADGNESSAVTIPESLASSSRRLSMQHESRGQIVSVQNIFSDEATMTALLDESRNTQAVSDTDQDKARVLAGSVLDDSQSSGWHDVSSDRSPKSHINTATKTLATSLTSPAERQRMQGQNIAKDT